MKIENRFQDIHRDEDKAQAVVYEAAEIDVERTHTAVVVEKRGVLAHQDLTVE